MIEKPQQEREDCQRRYMQRCSTKVEEIRATADKTKAAYEYAEAQLQQAEAELSHARNMYEQVQAMAPVAPPVVRMHDDDVTMRGVLTGVPGAAPASPQACRSGSHTPTGSVHAPGTPVAPSPTRIAEQPPPPPSVIAAIQQDQAKCFADQAALNQQMQAFIAQFGPVISHLQAAAQNTAARVPVEAATPPKKVAYVPPPPGQRTLAQSLGAKPRSSSVATTHRGPGAVRRSPSRPRSAPYEPATDEHKSSDGRSRSPCDEPSRPSGAVINPAEEREAARRANFPGGIAPGFGESAMPLSPDSRLPDEH